MKTRGPVAAVGEIEAGGLSVPEVHTKVRIAMMKLTSDQQRNTAGIERKIQTFQVMDVVVCSAISAHWHAFLMERIVWKLKGIKN